MKEITELERRLGLIALCIGIAAAFILLPLKNNAVTLGLCLGTGVSVLNFGMLTNEAIKKSSRALDGKMGIFPFGHLLRYAFIAVALFVAAEKGTFYFLGAALGLFTVRSAIFLDTFLISKWTQGR